MELHALRSSRILSTLLLTTLVLPVTGSANAEGWWQARANFVAVDDGTYDGDIDLGDAFIQTSIGHDNSFSLSLERRFGDRVGVELWAFSAKPSFDLAIIDLPTDQARVGHGTLDIFAATLGLSIHLSPNSRFDFYAQPLVGMMNVEDMRLTDGGDTLDLVIDDDMVAGFAIGFDLPLKDSRWSFNANIRYLDLTFEPQAEDGTKVELGFEPIVVGLGLGFRF